MTSFQRTNWHHLDLEDAFGSNVNVTTLFPDGAADGFMNVYGRDNGHGFGLANAYGHVNVFNCIFMGMPSFTCLSTRDRPCNSMQLIVCSRMPPPTQWDDLNSHHRGFRV